MAKLTPNLSKPLLLSPFLWLPLLAFLVALFAPTSVSAFVLLNQQQAQHVLSAVSGRCSTFVLVLPADCGGIAFMKKPLNHSIIPDFSGFFKGLFGHVGAV